MADIIIPSSSSPRARKTFDSSHAFQTCTTLQSLTTIASLTDPATASTPHAHADYPSRHVQLEEALTNLRMQTQLMPVIQRPVARVIRIMFKGNLYHALDEHKRMPLDIEKDISDVVQLCNGTLRVQALNGLPYAFDMRDISAYRIDESYTYNSRSAFDSAPPPLHSLSHLLNQLDRALQLPQGVNALLAQRNRTTKSGRRTDFMRDLIDQYVAYLAKQQRPANTITSRRIQLIPSYKAVTPTFSYPSAFLSDLSEPQSLITQDGDYLVIEKTDGFPFVIKRSALRGYRVQDIRESLLPGAKSRPPTVTTVTQRYF